MRGLHKKKQISLVLMIEKLIGIHNGTVFSKFHSINSKDIAIALSKSTVTNLLTSENMERNSFLEVMRI